jgi:hypothetical protein
MLGQLNIKIPLKIFKYYFNLKILLHLNPATALAIKYNFIILIFFFVFYQYIIDMDIKQYDVLLFFKLLIFGYIIISPFINNSWLKFINYTPIKIIILIIIILLSFIDLQLAILVTIAFLVILINLNKYEIIAMNKKVKNVEEIKEHMIRGQSIFPIPSDILQPPLSTDISQSDISQFKVENFQNEQYKYQNVEAGDLVNMQLQVDSHREALKSNSFGVNDKNPSQVHRINYDDQKVDSLKNETNIRQIISEFPKPYCYNIEYDPILISESASNYELDYHTKPYEEYVKNLTPEMAKEIIPNY